VSGLRFAMVTTFYPPYNFGGDGMGIQRLSEALARRGHRVTVVQDVDGYRALSRGSEPPQRPTPPNLEVVRLESRLGRLSTLLTQQLGRPVVHGRRLRELLGDGRFDVINFHNISLVGGPGVLRAGDALKLYMAHEHWLVCPSHVLWRHDREACSGRQCLRCVLRFRRPPQYWRYSGLLERELRHVDRFIAMSEFSRAKHREFGFPREMEVVSYFLPMPEPRAAADAETDPPHERPYFLFVGRLERIKGLDDVIPVFERYDRADLLIAGDGEHADRLREIAAGNPRVRFLGRVAPDALDRYYAHAVALIVPSVGFETFGIILIESFRQRTPVIARRIGPFPEIVQRSGGGELFDGPDELAAALGRMQADPARRERLARAGWEGFVRNWSEPVVVPRYLEVVRRTAIARGRTDIADKLEAEGVA